MVVILNLELDLYVLIYSLIPKHNNNEKLFVITALLIFAGIASGQTLKKGSIVSISYYEVILQPDVTMNQYLEFLNTKYKAAFEKAFPGVTIIN